METEFRQLLQWLTANPNPANAFAAVASALAALLALVVSVAALFIAGWAAHLQRRHNRLSVRPIPEVTVLDLEEHVRVKLRNHGSGPLVIEGFEVAGYGGKHETLVDAMPNLPGRDWTHFSGNIGGRALLPGGEIVLLELLREDDEIGFGRSRDLARKALALATLSVNYTDIYGGRFQPYSKSLEWFGRHWATA